MPICQCSDAEMIDNCLGGEIVDRILAAGSRSPYARIDIDLFSGWFQTYATEEACFQAWYGEG